MNIKIAQKLACNQRINFDLPAEEYNISFDFDVYRDVIMMAKEDLTNNSDCMASTSFQIEHPEGSNTTSTLMWNVLVMANLTLDRNLSDAIFLILKTINANNN